MLDLRIKIPKEKYADVIIQYNQLHSYNKVAQVYKVDPSTIRRIIHPIVYEEMKAYHRARQDWKKNYNKVKRSEIQRRHRARKKQFVQPLQATAKIE